MDPHNSLPGSSVAMDDCSNAEASKKYARWRAEERRIFIAACETAVAEGHRPGKCFTKEGWNRVITLFNSISGHNWSKIQLRNHWDAMRREHERFTELLSFTGVKYNPSDGRLVASEKWWNRKIKENKDFKDFKDKDVSEIYTRYHQLFGDGYDCDKYAVTPAMLCRMGFGLFEDNAAEDHRDAIPVDGESTGAKGEEGNCTSNMNACGPRSGEKRKSATSSHKGKKKRVSARDLFCSVDRVNSIAEEVAVKINTIMASQKNTGVACVEELLEAGKLKRRTPLYFYACTLLAQKRYRDMLSVMQDVDEKFEWIEWQFNERNKSLH